MGFGALEFLLPIGRSDLAFFDHCLIAGEQDLAREREIYSVLFPSSPVGWVEYAAQKGADENNRVSGEYFRWRNQLLDAQAFWAHDNAGRDVFVTSDKRFRKLQDSAGFPDAVVRTPEGAVDLL